MIKNLALMFIASIIICLIVQSHRFGLLYTGMGSLFYIAGYIIGFAAALVATSFILAIIPRVLYWIFRVKKVPAFIIFAFAMWMLIVVMVAGNQLYSIATHEEPTSIVVSDTSQTHPQKMGAFKFLS